MPRYWQYCFCCFLLTSCSLLQLPDRYTEEQKLRSAQYLLQAATELEKQDLQAARASYQLAYEIVPNAIALDGLGAICHRRKHYADALEYYIRANQLDPHYPGVLANLALLYYETGNYRQAQKFFVLANQKNPDNFKIKNNFSVHTFVNGDISHAWELMNMAKMIKKDRITTTNYHKLEAFKAKNE